MSITITQEQPDSEDAKVLIGELDDLLAPNYPTESRHGYSVDTLLQQEVAFFVMRHGTNAAGCGGVQLFGADLAKGECHAPAYGELKRMYVRPTMRGQGLGQLLLEHLIEHVQAQGIGLLRLETGIYQTAAIRLYERAGFVRIPPFGDYFEDPVSRCYEKHIA